VSDDKRDGWEVESTAESEQVAYPETACHPIDALLQELARFQQRSGYGPFAAINNEL
jgi:hypothetical protein